MNDHDDSGAVIGRSAELMDGGRGIRFECSPGIEAFAVRHQGCVRAWLNRCPHQGTALDWEPGEFFSADGLRLECATHGAQFDPASGACVSGPCKGASLRRIAVHERDGLLLRGAPGIL